MTEDRVSRPTGNLPTLNSRFIGRKPELAEVRRLLGSSRLLTLTGPGGVGKTRLAVEAGLRIRRAFPDGTWLVDLAAIDDVTRLADAVAAALGVEELSARGAKEQVRDFLADRLALVILDNCEHLRDGCAELVDHMLRIAPRLRVVATSRQPLEIAGEHVLTVEPLAFPDVDGAVALEDMSRCDAVALLIDRATAVQPSFALHSGNRDAVVSLCARLDGLPLAIELAASRLRSLSVEQVVARLDDRFALLTRGNPLALSRQQTLRALIDWSHALCTEEQRLLWARLSVFPGEFDLEAVENVCGGPGVVPAAVVDLVDDLVARSVVVARLTSRGVRYRMLETIRQYGGEILAASGQECEVRRRHRDHYVRTAAELCERWCGPDQSDILTRLRLENINFEAAMDFSLAEPGEEDVALELVSALRYHWTLGGFLAAGHRRLEQVLRAAHHPTRARGDALWVAAWVALLVGQRDTAAARVEECEQLARDLDDEHLQAYGHLLRGSIGLFSGDLTSAAEQFDRGISLMRRCGDTAAVLWGSFQYSLVLSHTGDHAAAQERCEESIRLARRHGEEWAQGAAMWAQAFDRWRSGDVGGDLDGSAEAQARRALAMTPNANLVSTVLTVELLAWIAASRQRPEEAARLLGASAAMWESFGADIAAFGPDFAEHSAACRETVITHLGSPLFDTLFVDGRVRWQDLLRSGETGPAGARKPALPDGPVLTRREGEVAGLIARGLTNKAIAAKLLLSRRTVEGHVARLFTKINVSNRAQVATWVTQNAHGRPEVTGGA
ncbi:ATP-binding protein [Pseudonocardia xinjiangensis]|uniref:LuxR family transcriptional regulator n=1 Tax=Pseudonocardia xinjiangensis TaxID=75289 RepID=A0ABX1RAK3_9PSEU|nr:LuxR C-terminal-related transcriptional regulator [Pseudonocardia xinjiangensis]NMH77432.1 LuxR family transcriptional regulator [Pseudonocardia xinjiangensis]